MEWETGWALLVVVLLAAAIFWMEADMEVTRWKSE